MSNEEKKISKNREKKVEIIANLNEKLGKAKAIVFTNYQGLTHKQLEGLKKAIKPLKAEFVVAKNTLVLRALDENKIKLESEKDLQGQTGTLFIYEDVISPLKELAKLIKNLGIPSVKFGIMDGARVSGEQILKLSILPSREVLLMQLVGGLKSPIFGLHRTLNWNLQKLVMTLNAVTHLPRPEPSDGGQANIKPATAVSATAPAPVAQTPIEEKTEPETATNQPSENKAEQTQEENSQNENQKNKGGEN